MTQLARVESPDPAGRWLAGQALEALEEQARAYDREGKRDDATRCRGAAQRLAAADPAVDYLTWLEIKPKLQEYRRSWLEVERFDVAAMLDEIIQDADRRARTREIERVKQAGRAAADG